MANISVRNILSGIFKNEAPKSPWGGGSGGGNGGSGDGKGGGSGPRNPWSLPPDGRRPRPGAGGTLDELLKRARRGGGGGNGGGSGIPGLPTGPRLYVLVAAGLLAIWIAFTSFHSIGPQERGVVTTLGRFSGQLEPGLRFTLPEPLSSVDTIDVQAIRDENFPENGSGENLMLTGDQNIVDLAYLVQWSVRDAPDYVYQIAKPRETVRATAETAMRAVVATASLNDTITSGRARIEAQVLLTMQQILDEYHSGIVIQSVSIQKSAAPQAVDEDFKQVTAAQQQAQANKNNAQAYAQQVIAAAQGDAAEFDKIYEQYKLAPEVTRRRIYYETMEQVLSRTNKTIVESPGVTPYLALPTLKKPDDGVETPAKPVQGGSR
ncbi:protease modulator HflK [Sphingomonas sp. JC676]|uniref:protease modulator HflK n=1 Tax=Sphingomonas sp. JC676 TaxID=2768065 RepID=UPI001657A869|nr:protease modulator HflK [Sphingomonas sp. JC676]MBC9034200.1 protease modulator HflK [Sphingomonas sp. JC676]